MVVIGYIVLIAGLAFDGLSAVLNVRKVVQGPGSSGVPFVPLLLSLGGAWLVASADDSSWLGRFPAFYVALIGYHLLCQYGIPEVAKRITRR